MHKLINPTIAAVVFLMGAVQVIAAETDVSPELARKTARFLTEKYNPGEIESGYEVRVSEPKVYYDYDRSRKYYVIYLYFGPGKMPAWEGIEKNPDAYEREGSYARSYIIPADKREYFHLVGWPTFPTTLLSHNEAETNLQCWRPGNWEYSRTIIATDQVYFIFRKGAEEIIVDRGGSLVNLGDLPRLDLCPQRFQIWDEVEKYLEPQNGPVEGKLIEGTDSGWIPFNWDNTMPTYYQYSGTPPKEGRWGCCVATTADFLGYYSGEDEYSWNNCPYNKNQYLNQIYGLWIMAGNNKDGIYYKFDIYGDPHNMFPFYAILGLKSWLQTYYGSISDFGFDYEDRPFNIIQNWDSVTYWLTGYNGVVLWRWPTAGQAHCFALYGWKEEGGHHWLAGMDPNYESRAVSKTPMDIDAMTQGGFTWALIRCSNPKHGGGNEPNTNALK